MLAVWKTCKDLTVERRKLRTMRSTSWTLYGHLAIRSMMLNIGINELLACGDCSAVTVLRTISMVVMYTYVAAVTLSRIRMTRFIGISSLAVNQHIYLLLLLLLQLTCPSVCLCAFIENKCTVLISHVFRLTVRDSCIAVSIYRRLGLGVLRNCELREFANGIAFFSWPLQCNVRLLS